MKMIDRRIPKYGNRLQRQRIDDMPCQQEALRTNLFEEEDTVMNKIYTNNI